MRVSVETGEGLERRMSVDLSSEQLKEKVDHRLKELAGTVRLDGFRPGKVPLRVVRQRFGAQVRQEAYGELIQSTFYEAASQENLRPAGEPQIDLRGEAEDGGFGYTATFEVMPEIEIADASGLKIQRPAAEVAAPDVDEMIERLRKQRAEWEAVERAAANGDQVEMDYRGLLDGEAFDGGSAEGARLELGSGRMVPGFEEGLVGANAGEERVIDVTFPDDYRAEHLQGKTVQFEITVHQVLAPKLPEIDEEFAREFGVEDGGVDAMRTEIRGNLERELTQKIRSLMKDRVMDVLLESNPIDVPGVMVRQEAQSLKQQAVAEMAQSGRAPEVDLPAGLFEEQAKRRVTLGLIVGEIIRGQGLAVTEEAVREKIQEFAGAYQNPQEVVDFYLNDENQRGAVENLVMEDLVVAWVLDRVEVETVNAGFDEVMNMQS